MGVEAKLWMRQAEADLSAAKDSLKDGHYEWASFAAQQCVEKALKALHISKFHQAPPKTHFLDELILPFDPDEELSALAAEISEDYTLARYPDAAEAIPSEMYSADVARHKIESAGRLLEWARKQMEMK
jgi:HEPN domain-containing protein